MIRNKYLIGMGILATVTAGSTLLVLGCGKKGSDPVSAVVDNVTQQLTEGSAITISGSLSTTGTGTSLSLTGTDLTSLSVYCVSFSIPPVAGTAAVGANGSFSLSLAAAQVSVGCFILSADNEQLGTIVFENPEKTNMDGTPKAESRQAFAGNVSLGAIVLDLDTGKAVVDVSQIAVESIKDTSAAEADAWDFSGNYVMTSAGITMPTGYEGTCPPRVEGQDSDCHGPEEGESIWVKRVQGTQVSDGSPVFGIMVWESEAEFNQCGATLGITYADARENGGVDLSTSGIAGEPFDWDDNFAEGWKYTAARANHDLMKMESVEDFYGYPGIKQYFSQYRLWTCDQGGCNQGTPVLAAGYMFNANTNETGCRLNGTPYQLQNWDNMNCQDTTDLGSGLHRSVCTKTVTGVGQVSCTHIGGAYLADGTPIGHAEVRYPDDFAIIAQGPYCDTNANQTRDAGDTHTQWNGDTQSCQTGTLVAGQLCSAIDSTGDDQVELTKLRCYAEALWQHEEDAVGCTRDISPDWSAQSAEGFMLENGPAKARAQYVFEGFNYDSPTSGSFRQESIRNEGIQNGNNWTDCRVIERMSMSLRKIEDSNDLLVEMISETRNASPKPACIAEYGSPQVSKSIFKMARQP